MKKLLDYLRLRNICLTIIVSYSILIGSFAIAKSLNFGIHQEEFINNDCKLNAKDFPRQSITFWTCKFSDGCIASWTSDISGAYQRNFRWIEYKRHGRLM